MLHGLAALTDLTTSKALGGSIQKMHHAATMSTTLGLIAEGDKLLWPETTQFRRVH